MEPKVQLETSDLTAVTETQWDKLHHRNTVLRFTNSVSEAIGRAQQAEELLFMLRSGWNAENMASQTAMNMLRASGLN